MNSLKFVLQIPKQLRKPFCELPEPRALPWCRVCPLGVAADHEKLVFFFCGGGGGRGVSTYVIAAILYYYVIYKILQNIAYIP